MFRKNGSKTSGSYIDAANRVISPAAKMQICRIFGESKSGNSSSQELLPLQ